MSVGLDVRSFSWFAHTSAEVQRLRALRPNWDSYGGAPPTLTAELCGVAFLLQAIPDDAPDPTVVPCSDGGLQFEWHYATGDLEIEAGPEGGIEVWCTQNPGDTVGGCSEFGLYEGPDEHTIALIRTFFARATLPTVHPDSERSTDSEHSAGVEQPSEGRLPPFVLSYYAIVRQYRRELLAKRRPARG